MLLWGRLGVFLSFFFKDFIYLFLERGERRKRNINVRQKHWSFASCKPPARDLAHNPSMSSDWNRTGHLLACGTSPNPLSHTSQDCLEVFQMKYSFLPHPNRKTFYKCNSGISFYLKRYLLVHKRYLFSTMIKFRNYKSKLITKLTVSNCNSVHTNSLPGEVIYPP